MSWTTVCDLDDLLPERGVAALVGERQVAVFRLVDGAVHCVDHADPFSGANVIARGIVGTRTLEGEEVPVVTSPMYKQPFDLRSGACLTDESVALAVWPVRVLDGKVQIEAS